MIGIVIVSHSAKLAAGIRELAEQMAREPVPIAIAAGIDDPDNPLGTDPMRVYEAIESVYDEAGVLVLMDLGSAVMSAEMALEFLPEDKQKNVRLCEAPLVEGAIAAVVQAATGASLDAVIAETRSALAAKLQALQGTEPSQPTPTPTTAGETIQLTVNNPLGIHARPAAQFVQLASQFLCEIWVSNSSKNSDRVNAKSINKMTTLGVRQGHQIAIAADGEDAIAALSALRELVESGFGEMGKTAIAPETPPAAAASPAEIQGMAASPGIAIAPVVLYKPALPEIEPQTASDPAAEWQKLQRALKTARRQIQTVAHKISTPDEAAIFEAHKLYLKDPSLLDLTHRQMFENRLNAATAWKSAIDETVATYEAMEDSYLQARGVDVRDVGLRVLRLLMPELRGIALDLPQPGILVATELKPSEVAQLDPAQVLGICTATGSANTHSAILARSLGIPAVMGIGGFVSRLTNGTPIALDGETGQVWIQPHSDRLRELEAKQTPAHTGDRLPEQTHTADGRQVPILANIVGVAGAKVALEAGAEGVGLFRTEFLYLDRTTPPTEAEQYDIYRAIAELFQDRPAIVRTFDIGGDKPLSYLHLDPEPNPFLGWRGIRLALERSDLLKTQLRAILRSSAEFPLKVMFPMICSVGEVRAAKKILAQAQEELRQEGLDFDEAIAVGITIEVPSAVAIADRLAAEVDFFSIGTNDLSQYSQAADRSNPKVSHLADPLEPAVLREIDRAVQAAHNAGISVGVCGELASDPEATPILLGLGVDELSMNSTAIAAVKATISLIKMADAKAIASAVLQLDSAKAVRNYLAETIRY